MNIGISLFWFIVIISLYLSYLFNFRAYTKDGERRQTNMALIIMSIILSFIPVVNVIYIMYTVYELRNYTIKSYFLKKF